MSEPVEEIAQPAEPSRLPELSAEQWKSGIAAWLGWLFDGLDMHLYTIVAIPFVASLMLADEKSQAVSERASWIQAAFLVGWALGGGFFGRIGDRLGRSRALVPRCRTASTRLRSSCPVCVVIANGRSPASSRSSRSARMNRRSCWSRGSAPGCRSTSYRYRA